MNFPNNPNTGDIHTVNNKNWQYNGTAWNALSKDALYSGDTLPANEAPTGSTWFNQNNGGLYYKDVSAMWVEVRGAF